MPTADVPLSLEMMLLIGAVLCGSAIVWALIAWRIWHRQPLIPYEPRQPVPWGANDLVLTILFTAVLGYIAGQTLDHFYSGHAANVTKAAEFYTISAVELCGVVIGVVLMRLQAGATWANLGLNVPHLARDLGLGAAGFLAAATPLMLLQALLEHWVAYKQPLIEAVNAHPDTPIFVSTAVTALVAAPLFEEFIFRVLLQGWFEGIEVKRRVMRLGLPGEGPAWWPIVLSAFLFAVMHIGQGAAPIPLFFFALVLGYLYQRTHRIWPSLLTHFLLNSGSLLLLWYQIQHVHM